MNPRHTKPISSAAVGCRIESLRYDAEAGYVVIELDSGEELWVQADGEGYHIFFNESSDSMSERQHGQP